MKCENCGNKTDNPRFCSRSCAATVNNVKTKTKEKPVCLNCNGVLPRGRKFCSNKCQGEHTRSESFSRIENGSTKEYVVQYRKYLIEKYGAKCMLCGWDKLNSITKKCPLELDHIDGHSEDNRLSNLRLVCPNCSSLQSTYKGLNKGNGRHSRMKRYKEGKSY